MSSRLRRAGIRLVPTSNCRWTGSLWSLPETEKRRRGATCFQSLVAIRMLRRSRPPSQRPLASQLRARTLRGSWLPSAKMPGHFGVRLPIPGRKHAVRHLVAVSEELSLTQAGANPDAQRTILCDDDTRFILYRLGVRFGLPVLPEWSEWVVDGVAAASGTDAPDRVGLPSCPRERHKSIAAESCEHRPEARSADDFGQRLHGAVEFAWPVSGCRIRDSTLATLKSRSRAFCPDPAPHWSLLTLDNHQRRRRI